MPSISMQQFFVRNEELKPYPKVSIDSIQSRYLLMISSTSNIYGKCFFVLTIISSNLLHCRYLLYNFMDPSLSIQFKTFLYVFLEIAMFSSFYFNYNHNLLKQIEEHWNGLQIDYDYETRKYFWTHKAIYRRLTYAMLLILNISYQFHLWNDNYMIKYKGKLASVIFYLVFIICGPIHYFNHFCKTCINMDLPILAQTAVQFNLIKLKKLLDESAKDENSLDINDIQNIRYKYLLSCRLVDKINEIMSPLLLCRFTYFLLNAWSLSYSLLYAKQGQSYQWLSVIQSGLILTAILLYTHSSIKIHEKSLELLATVYKLSLKTNSMALLNEISLFLKHEEIGFTFGGIFMLTTSSLSTLFSILITVMIALPSFSR
uniref:Gustatory receptor n=1 Tax=Tetranychus urticae TaxID=32264 RepID=A0A158P5F2_TETUR